MKKRYSVGRLIMAGIVGFVLATLLLCGIIFYKFGGFGSLPYAAKFADVYNTINKEFVGTPDMGKVSDAAYSAMVGAINDRWSYYMTADQYKDYQQYRDNTYTGIGVTIEADSASGLYKVVTVTENSPAQKAGIVIGDLLYAINGNTLQGQTSDSIKKSIAGLDGDFQLTLKTEDGAEKSVTVSKEVVYTKPVSYEMLDNGVGYIKIKNFESGSGDGINSAIDDLQSQGAKGIVFDVRDNPGGLLSELLKALDKILPEGDIFVSADKEGHENVKTSDASCVKLPMTVLVNENSYSAAEFFAAALSEYHWATLVGTHTTGKARSQINIVLSDGSAVHLSTNSYLTPNRIDLAATGGLKPNLEIDLSKDEENQFVSGTLSHDKDEQLSAALKEINTLINK